MNFISMLYDDKM